MEMRIVLSAILRRCALRPASQRAEHSTRRNVTLSPRHGTRVIVSPRAASSRPSVATGEPQPAAA
jgi:cytochrome P450